MNPLIGTPQCPHLGFDAQGVPCCHADGHTRTDCGRDVPNPKVSQKEEAQADLIGVARYFCTVLGKDAVPGDALKAAQKQRVRAVVSEKKNKAFQPPGSAGRTTERPSREQHPDRDPVIPTHQLRNEEGHTRPNEPCPCGSGRKYKKCCGR